MVIDHHNHLARLVILQDLVSAVDFGMLVDQAVARIVPNELDGRLQLVHAADPVPGRGHFGTARNGICPQEHGDGSLNRVGQGGEAYERDTISRLTCPGAATVDADVAG